VHKLLGGIGYEMKVRNNRMESKTFGYVERKKERKKEHRWPE